MTAFCKPDPFDWALDALEERFHYDVLRFIKLAIDQQGRHLDLAQFRFDIPRLQVSNDMKF